MGPKMTRTLRSSSGRRSRGRPTVSERLDAPDTVVVPHEEHEVRVRLAIFHPQHLLHRRSRGTDGTSNDTDARGRGSAYASIVSVPSGST